MPGILMGRGAVSCVFQMLFNYFIGQLRPTVFINNTFIIHRARPIAPLGSGYTGIAELPDGGSADVRMVQVDIY